MFGEYAAAGEGVNVRGLEVGEDPLDTEIGVTVIVGVDDDEVGLGERGGEGVGTEQAPDKDGEEAAKSFHEAG